MVQETLNELVNLSNELAQLQGKPPGTPLPLPDNSDLHPELAEVLASGALALKWHGVDASRIGEFTDNAKRRGLRRKAIVFGWHPRGHTWYAAPEKHDADAQVLVIDRLDRLSAKELTIPEFVELFIEGTRTEIAEAKAPKPEPEPEPEPERRVEPPKLYGRRKAKVVLADSKGATVTADGKTHKLAPDVLAYILWCMRELQLTTEDRAPDLTRWQRRALRASRLDAIPAKKHADYATYAETLNQLTSGDRSAPGSVSYQIPTYKLEAPGSWILCEAELAVLRRADKATPPRHRHTAPQEAIWKRWIAIIQADNVEIQVH